MIKNIAALLACLLTVGCTKQTQPDCVYGCQASYLKATVIQTSDVACHRPILDFTEDSLRIRAFTHADGFYFSATGLPENLNMVGNRLYVSVALLQPGELFPCNALGIYYYPLKVQAATTRE